MPPHITFEEAWGFGISKVKEALIGIHGEHEQWEAGRTSSRPTCTRTPSKPCSPARPAPPRPPLTPNLV